MHAQGYKQCADQPVGTYITPVPNFLEGYLKHYQQIQQDKGYDDYELPEAAQYAYCTRTVKNGNEYWLQMGCSDGTSQKLAVNIYSDNTCTTRSTVNGYDDANIDVSEIQVGFFSFNETKKDCSIFEVSHDPFVASFQTLPSLCYVGRSER